MPSRRVEDITLRIATQVQKNAAKGVQAAAIFLAARLKETLSIPAPRKRVVNSRGDIRYVATTRAIPGAPPRKLSGRLRQSVTYILLPGQKTRKGTRKVSPAAAVVGVKARSDKGFNYPRYHEEHDHKFMAPTIEKYRQEIITIVGRPINSRIV